MCFGECYAGFSLRSGFIIVTQAGISCTWTNDSQRILLEYFDIIHNSPSQLYHSALPLSPSSSLLHKFYGAEFSKGVSVVKRLPAEWGVCSRTVLLEYSPLAISYWNNTIAVGSAHRDIIILDAITGSQIAVLSGHGNQVNSVAFSSDGILLVSGGNDRTVQLWDVQTGGVIKKLYGHNSRVCSVSISADHTMIASGSSDSTVRLWDIQMGKCHQIIQQEFLVSYVAFSPTDSKCFISVSGVVVQQWDTNGHKVGPINIGHRIAFSPDGTQFILHDGAAALVQNVNSGVTVAEFQIASTILCPCCFSPNGRLVAVAANYDVCVWDITGSDPCLVEIFTGHTNNITSLAFSSPSTLISASEDYSLKFWQIGISSTSPVVNQSTISHTPAPITKSAALQIKGVIIPSGLEGSAKTWGISTSLSKVSLQTTDRDTQQRDSRLVFVWHANEKINIWDAEKGELFQKVDQPGDIMDLRISEDGSKVFCLDKTSLKAWDICTGEAVGEVEIKHCHSFYIIDGSRVWIKLYDSQTHGWDFGTSDPSPVQLSGVPPDVLYLDSTKLWDIRLSVIKDVATGRVVFQLPRKPVGVQRNGQYLVIYYKYREVFVLDLKNVLC